MDTNNITIICYGKVPSSPTRHHCLCICTSIDRGYLPRTRKQILPNIDSTYPQAIPSFLEGRPQKVQSLCMLNMERAKSVSKTDLKEIQRGIFYIKSKDNNVWKTDLTNGTCTCPAFMLTNIPCKHFFAVFYHTAMWNWNDLPSSLTESSHMVLDRISDFITTDGSPVLQTITTTTSSGQELPRPKMTTATHIYHLQKQIEDTVSKCRTLAFLTNDTKVLEEALAHCEAARAKLATSTTSAQDPFIPQLKRLGLRN